MPTPPPETPPPPTPRPAPSWSADGLWGIGELAERAGATVKTVRFYSDHGLLPEASRSTGGHRRYAHAALERLRLIRALRTLDLPLPAVRRILDPAGDPGDPGNPGAVDDGALEDAVAGHLRELGSQMAALRWREAALRLVRDCTPAERADRLRLVGAIGTPPDTTAMARFWRRWLPVRLPSRVTAAILEHAVPDPPADPTPEQVLAFARLHAFVTGDCSGDSLERCQPAVHRPGEGYQAALVYDGLVDAYALAAPHLLAARPPQPGDALDCFVDAYARARGTRDTPAFRGALQVQLAADPRVDHYWREVAVLRTPPSGPPPPTPGAAHDWLTRALTAESGLSAA
ncbi:MerR family transcriptional regulator [Streptomycetaceae bacterium NBC_01309]